MNHCHYFNRFAHDFSNYNQLLAGCEPFHEPFWPRTWVIELVSLFQQVEVRLKVQHFKDVFFVELQQGSNFSDVESVSGFVLDESLDDFRQEVTVPVLEGFEFIAQLGPAESEGRDVVQLPEEFFEITDWEDGESETEGVGFVDVDLWVGVGLLQGLELLWGCIIKISTKEGFFLQLNSLFQAS